MIKDRYFASMPLKYCNTVMYGFSSPPLIYSISPHWFKIQWCFKPSTSIIKHAHPLGNVCSDLNKSCTYLWKLHLECVAVFQPIDTDKGSAVCLRFSCYLMEFGLLTDSHFAIQQSQFSRLFIRLFQPLSLAACQLRDNVTHRLFHWTWTGPVRPPWCCKAAQLS